MTWSRTNITNTSLATFARSSTGARNRSSLNCRVNERNRLIATIEVPEPFVVLLEYQAMSKLLVFICIFGAVACAQNESPPSAKREPSTLATTLKQIQDKVNSQGEIRYTMISENTVQGGTVEDHYAVETSGAVADPRSCSIQVDARMSLNGKTQSQGRVTVPFRDLTSVDVRKQSQLIEEKTTRAGITAWKGTIKPENYVVQMSQKGELYGMFFFRDEDSAKLVAASVNQVIQPCGAKVQIGTSISTGHSC